MSNEKAPHYKTQMGASDFLMDDSLRLLFPPLYAEKEVYFSQKPPFSRFHVAIQAHSGYSTILFLHIEGGISHSPH